MTAALTGHLPDSTPSQVFPLFRDLAERLELPRREDDGGLVIQLRAGEIGFSAKGGGLALTLQAENQARLYMLQQVVFNRLDQLGPEATVLWEQVSAGAMPPTLTVARVEWIRRISPGFRRVRVTGPDLARYAGGGLHFRLLLPPLGRPPVWPRIGADGRTIWPEGTDALHRPVYTVRAFDAEAGWLDFDVFLHSGGRTTDWTAAAAPGAFVGLMGPTGRELPETDWLALFGDETSMPAVIRILEALPPSTRGQAFVLTGDPADRQPVAAPAGMELHWLTRGASPDLVTALEALEPPARGRFAWFAAEKSQAEAARRLLRERLGFGRRETSVTAYWSATRDDAAG